MSGEPPPSSTGRAESGAGSVSHLDPALWRQLGNATSVEDFCQSWLALQSRMIGGVSAGLVMLERPGSGSLAPTATWPHGFRETDGLKSVVERTLRERKGVVTRNDTDTDTELDSPDELRYHLAYPILEDDELRGVAVVVIEPRAQTQLRSAMRQLQWGVAWLHNWVLRNRSTPDSMSHRRLTAALELVAVTLQHGDLRGAATAFVTELATRLECDRVSLGFVEGAQVKVRAFSHSAEFGKEMNLIRAIGVAMAESVDQQAVLTYPASEGDAPHVLHAHEQLARSHGDGAVCTLPLVDSDGRTFGALTLERSVAEAFDRDALELCEGVAALVGPILEAKRQNDRALLGKIGASLWTQVQALIGPRHAVLKLVVAGLIGAFLFFTFATGRYRVTAETVLEGEIQRVIAAPYRGYIFDAAVRAGDVVERGQVLCNLDERDLRLEYSKWSTEREQRVIEHRRAMADGDFAATNVLNNKMRQAEAQLEMLDEQLDRARIVAPFDAVVVSGDLSQSLGAPVDAGQVLFELAPLDSYRVMLQIDEREITQIRVGQTGELVLTAMPGTRVGLRVTKITPVSMTVEGRNFFTAEAELGEISDRLRPGMEGFAKIDVDRRKLIWIWTHDLVDWVRLKAWSWLP